MRAAPDDELFRVNAVWLGPQNITFPWTARYLAYAVWLAVFGGVLLTEAVTPLTVHIPPAWEICVTTLTTYLVMGCVDHERPIRSVLATLTNDLAAARAPKTRTLQYQTRHTTPPPRKKVPR